VSALTNVTDATFAEIVLGSPVPAVVDFWAEWCPPCRPVAKIVEELAAEFDGRLRIVTMNSDENPETSWAYRILSLPTLLFFQHGEVTRSIVGARPKAHFRRAFGDAVTPYANR